MRSVQWRQRAISAILPFGSRFGASLLACVLAGCYVSQAPFITPDSADYPIETGTHFESFAPAGNAWRSQPGRTLNLIGDHYVYVEDGDARPSVPFLLKRLSPTRYLAQINNNSDSARVTEYYYQLIEFDGSTALQYAGACRPREAWITEMLIERLERLSTNDRCIFTRFENLVAVLEDAAVNAVPEAKYLLTQAEPATP